MIVPVLGGTSKVSAKSLDYCQAVVCWPYRSRAVFGCEVFLLKTNGESLMQTVLIGVLRQGVNCIASLTAGEYEYL